MTPPPADDTSTSVMARPTGRDASIESLMALHDRDVRSALRKVLGRSQEEDDLVQEVFTRLVLRLRQPGDVVVGAWLRGVAHNLAVDDIRRRRPVPVEETQLDRELSCPADDVLAGDELYNCLVEGANGLPERQRAALAAALSGGGPGLAGVATVASSLGVSVHAAESLLSRARGGLRSHLAQTAGAADTGSVRVSFGAALAGVFVTLAWLARRWKATSVLALAGGALSLTSAVWLPALSGSTAPSASVQVTGAAAGAASTLAGDPDAGAADSTGHATGTADGDVAGGGGRSRDAAGGGTAGTRGGIGLAPATLDGLRSTVPVPPAGAGDVSVPDACTTRAPAPALPPSPGAVPGQVTGSTAGPAPSAGCPGAPSAPALPGD